MATPNDPTPLKKPAAGTPARPSAQGTPPQGARPGAKPPAPGAKPGAPPSKPGAPAGKPGAAPPKPGAKPSNGPTPAGAKPGAGPKPARKSAQGAGGKRRIGQVLVDLGFLDDDQLWEVLEEAKSTGQLTGQVALGRGLINDDQLWQALGEQHNLKTVNLGDVKPTPEALAQVPETMANVYKVLPLTFKDKSLTIAIGDPNNLAALDDLRNLLSINEVVAELAPPEAIAAALAKAYAGKEESIIDLIQEIENNPALGKRKAETSIDLSELVEIADAAPVRKLINMVFLLA